MFKIHKDIIIRIDTLYIPYDITLICSIIPKTKTIVQQRHIFLIELLIQKTEIIMGIVSLQLLINKPDKAAFTGCLAAYQFNWKI